MHLWGGINYRVVVSGFRSNQIHFPIWYMYMYNVTKPNEMCVAVHLKWWWLTVFVSVALVRTLPFRSIVWEIKKKIRCTMYGKLKIHLRTRQKDGCYKSTFTILTCSSPFVISEFIFAAHSLHLIPLCELKQKKIDRDIEANKKEYI